MQSPPHYGDMDTDAIQDVTHLDPNHIESAVPSPMDSVPMEVSEVDGSVGSPEETPMHIVPKEPTISDLLPDASHYYEEGDIVGEGVYRYNIENFLDLRNGDERHYSEEFTIAGHTWRLLIFPRGNRQNEFLSVFIESMDAKKPPEEIGDRWHTCVHFALAVANTDDPAIYSHSHAHHRFTAKESDWGFNQLVRFSELAQKRPEKSIYQDSRLTIAAYVRVVKDVTGVLWWNDLTDYDSKKETGFVGLKNQGATCYMNSLLQSLYFTNFFRKMVYQIPTDKDTPTNSIPLALQRVFYNLQFSSLPPDTRELTRSFGWTTLDAFMQHDVQEFNRVLQDNLETKMKSTKAEGAISKLFGGKFKSYVRCVNVDYESSRVEDFNDIQLVVKGIDNLRLSFENYVAVEVLDGDNKYAADGHGLQDAKKGISFIEFPPVLHLQLRRFEYDFQKDAMVKINDRFEFPPEIDLAEFLDESADKTQNWKYVCVGVLVHAGDTHGGHYYALIKPTKNGRWLRFDDDKVVPVTEREVYEENFGGESLFRAPGTKSIKRFVNAYMLVYMRETSMDELLSDVVQDDIPGHLVERIEKEREEAERERKEREELHLYMHVKVLTNAVIKQHSGFDLWNWDDKTSKIVAPTLKVRKDETLASFKKRLSEENGIPLEKMRLWSMAGRQNKTIRPDAPIPDTEDERRMEALKDRYARIGDLKLYVEESEIEIRAADGKVSYFLPKEESNPQQSILIFVKYFDPFNRKMEFAHSLVVRNRNLKLSDITPIIAERLSLPKDTPLRLYEEVKPGMIDQLKLKNTFSQSELGDGDILIAMKDLTDTEVQQFPPDALVDPPHYFEWYTFKTVVQFKPREVDPKPEAPLPEFEIEMSKKTHYDDVAKKVAQQVGLTDFLKLRFSLAQNASVAPRNLIKRTPTTTLHEMLQHGYQSPLTSCLYYEILDIPITELDTKRALKVTFMDYRNKEAGQHDLLVPKLATVEQVLETLRPKLKLDAEHGAGILRLFATSSGRMHIHPPTDDTTRIPETSQLYVEEVPVEEVNHPDSRPVPVFHFAKDPSRYHGVPFRIVLEPGDRWSTVKRKIQERLAVADKEWTKYRLCVVPQYSTRPTVLEDDEVLLEKDLRDGDYIGIDHPDKSKPVRGFAFEKAIKIFG
ncbi:cysteine proteinase [Gonapodya prolifera JEL478]|uniref:ubiquitinyl hydrolase 1 n=1 Tax=Gonapodya prolifera (strain JEL478) TaxID=1344416 RepID=A0A139AT06_GONPJ|nr:cysteine proteinase [Gonapodya prolifera JEL478]|eukprot:KXS19866.1 cysteine proteinase [Gonapodya prolifera JEL478]